MDKKESLTFLIKRTLFIRKAGVWRAKHFGGKVQRGEAKLHDLMEMAAKADCTLTFLTSGARYDAREHLSPNEATVRSIRHSGQDIHEFARSLGFRNYDYIRHMMNNNTIKVALLLKIAKALNMELWRMLCDNDYVDTSDADYTPTAWDRFKELSLMGWV